MGERTIRWDHPSAVAGPAAGMSGLELFQAMASGRIPLAPIMQLIGMTMAAAEHGRIAIDLTPMECHCNPLGAVHGGVIATALDSVLGAAVHSTLPAGRAFTTLEIKVNYLRAITPSMGVLRAEGRVLHAGRQVATAEADLKDGEGRLFAHGTTTCLVFDQR